jgi:hypothetical protein
MAVEWVGDWKKCLDKPHLQLPGLSVSSVSLFPLPFQGPCLIQLHGQEKES